MATTSKTLREYKRLTKELVQARRGTTSARSPLVRARREERWEDCLKEMDRFLTKLENQKDKQ